MAWIDDARVVDVSHWEPEGLGHREMDWVTAVAAGLVAAVPKYTQGIADTDPTAFLHAYNAYHAQVPFLGGYHFGDGSNGIAQADYFLKLIHQDYGPSLDGILLMLDLEANPSSQMTVDIAEAFVSRVQTTEGRWPWLYMGRDGPTGDRAGLPSAILSNCPLVIPAYGDHAANLGSILPPGWRMPTGAADRGEPGTGVVRAWQFTDGKINGGPFPGLGPVDQWRLVRVSSPDELRTIWGK